MILLAFILANLFPNNTPEQERQAILAAYFEPAPAAGVAISRSAMLASQDQPLKAEGFVWVTPPAGHCFIITVRAAYRDINACKKTKINFSIADISQNGILRFKVIQGPTDPGTYLYWQTPHRFANFSPLGDFKAGRNKTLPVFSCAAESSSASRKITLQLFDGTKWFVTFPRFDKLLKPKQEDPNLFVKVMTTTKEGTVLTKGFNGKNPEDLPPPTKKELKKKHSRLADKLSGRYKVKKKKGYDFITSPYESFEMNSSHFFMDGGPPGMNGKCRYRFQSAPGDPKAGLIECFNTDQYDAVFTHLACASQLSYSIEPKAP